MMAVLFSGDYSMLGLFKVMWTCDDGMVDNLVNERGGNFYFLFQTSIKSGRFLHKVMGNSFGLIHK